MIHGDEINQIILDHVNFNILTVVCSTLVYLTQAQMNQDTWKWYEFQHNDSLQGVV
jgi:hypothetical protein